MSYWGRGFGHISVVTCCAVQLVRPLVHWREYSRQRGRIDATRDAHAARRRASRVVMFSIHRCATRVARVALWSASKHNARTRRVVQSTERERARSRRLRARSSRACATSHTHIARRVESCADVMTIANIVSSSGATERRTFSSTTLRTSTSPAPRVVGRARRDEVAARARRAPDECRGAGIARVGASPCT